MRIPGPRQGRFATTTSSPELEIVEVKIVSTPLSRRTLFYERHDMFLEIGFQRREMYACRVEPWSDNPVNMSAGADSAANLNPAAKAAATI